MITKTLIALFGALALVMAAGFGHPRASAASSQNEGLSSLSTESLARLANSRIFFGHMSVGQNIIEGIEDLLAQHPTLKLNIVQTDAPDLSSPGFLAHGPVGDNWKPLEKIDDFDKKISGGLGEKTDIAFFKFCYIDMMAENTEDQDVDKVFSRYQQTMAKLKSQFPNTRFVHFTAPLTVVQTGPKAFVKKLFGKAPGWYLDNVKRHTYNEKVRKAYGGKEPLFDLALVEATRPDGSLATFEWQGQSYYHLVPEYGYDGRHLNEAGRRHVAERLLVFLARTLDQ